MNSEVILFVPGFRQWASSRVRVAASTFVLLLAVGCPPAAHAGLMWDTDIGVPLTDFSPFPFDGLEAVGLDPQYAFKFEGVTYTSLAVTTSGFVWLGGTNGSQCCILSDKANTLNAFENGPARIAPGWTDLRPDVSGTIAFNEISDSLGARTVITYMDVATDPTNMGHVSFQLQLYTSGVIVFSYLRFDSAGLGPNPAALIGFTPLLGSPQSFDIADVPESISSNSIYDYLISGGPGFDLSGQSLVFSPTADGWRIDTILPTPEPATLFLAGGFIFLFVCIRGRINALSSNKL